MKIIKLDQLCTVEHQGKYGWEASTINEPIYIVADHIESMYYTGNTNLRMISGDTIKVKESPEEILKLLGENKAQLHD
ncbi:TPA: flagellar FlbD family protein [Enterobacter hormaechei]|nr:flagellar FlbD family protein [Enterobacter hormaechei]